MESSPDLREVVVVDDRLAIGARGENHEPFLARDLAFPEPGGVVRHQRDLLLEESIVHLG